MRGSFLNLYEEFIDIPKDDYCCYYASIGEHSKCFCKGECYTCRVTCNLKKHAKYCKKAELTIFRESLLNYQTVLKILIDMKKEYYYANPHTLFEGKIGKNGKVKQFKYWFCYLPDGVLKIIANKYNEGFC